MTVLVIIAAIAAAGAKLSGGIRVLFAMVRDGLGRRSWATVNDRTRIPVKVAVFCAAVNLVVWGTTALPGLDAGSAFTYTITTGALLQTLNYVTVAAVDSLWLRRLRHTATRAARSSGSWRCS